MLFDGETITGHRNRFKYEFLPDDKIEAGKLIRKMEREGWEVLGITGADEGNSVIWFKKKIEKKRG